MTPPGFVFYKGPSQLDGAPIVGILTVRSRNQKTGKMLQTWIMRSDIAPLNAITHGQDESICGDCPLRPSQNGVCYVAVFQAPRQIWQTYSEGGYPPIADCEQIPYRGLRMGSYGDPAAIPFKVWKSLLERTPYHTGYTHQWRSHDELRGVCMASCDSKDEAIEAMSRGWKVFLVSPKGRTARHVTAETRRLFIECPAAEESSKGSTCERCRLCDGTRANIAIMVHGGGARRFNENALTI